MVILCLSVFDFRLRARPVENGHMTDDLQQGAVGGLGDAFGKFPAFLLEIRELDLDQFVQGQFVFNAGEKRFAHPVVSHFEDGFKKLCSAFEAATVGGCQCGLQALKMPRSIPELKNGNRLISEPWCI